MSGPPIHTPRLDAPSPGSHQPDREECLLASVAHLALFGGFWLIGPLAIYYLKGKSRYVAFHCVQAMLLSLAVIAGGAICVLLLVPGMMLVSVVGPQLGKAGTVALMVLAWVLGIGALALSPIVAFVAGARAFRGRWWQVPVLGRWALRWLDRPDRRARTPAEPTDRSASS